MGSPTRRTKRRSAQLVGRWQVAPQTPCPLSSARERLWASSTPALSLSLLPPNAQVQQPRYHHLRSRILRSLASCNETLGPSSWQLPPRGSAMPRRLFWVANPVESHDGAFVQ